MLDAFHREIDYLRVSLTDRCNLRCRYCMPEAGVTKLRHSEILSLEQVERVIRIAGERLGIRKVRLTGGEPLVRRGVEQLVRGIARLPFIEEIALTTNGLLFAEQAADLKAAGLSRVNFSLDTLQPEKFRYITRGGDVAAVRAAIGKAVELGLAPVKVNVVAIRGFNEDEILDLAGLAVRLPIHVRFIECMPVGDLPFYSPDKVLPIGTIRQQIGEHYALHKVVRGHGAGPAECYTIGSGAGQVGFISAMTSHFCASCNRLRLTADGKLRPCLYSNREINLKMALDSEAGDEIVARLLAKAIGEKPGRHHMDGGWGEENARKMCQIGG